MNKEEIKFEIGRHIGNRFFETHPFQRRSAGIAGFLELMTLLPQSDEEDFNAYVGQMEQLFGKLAHCDRCKGKMHIFLSLFMATKRPEKAQEHLRQALLLCVHSSRLREIEHKELWHERERLLSSRPGSDELRQFLLQLDNSKVFYRNYETEILECVRSTSKLNN